MKNIIQIIKDFKYKTITAIILLAISQVIYYFTESDFAWYSGIVFFTYIIGTIYKFIYLGIKNTYEKDGDKMSAIFFSVLLILFTGLIVYLLITNL